MIYVPPDSSLLDAFCALHGNAIRRLLVVDARRHNALYTVTHQLLLRFIYAKVRRLFVDCSVRFLFIWISFLWSSYEVLVWLSVWSEVQMTCMWSS